MAFRFRKRINLGGVKLNFGKRGFSSFTIGGRGRSINVGKKGARANLGIPGTGIGWSTRLFGRSDPSTQSQQTSGCSCSGCLGALIAVGGMGFVSILVCGGIGSAITSSDSPITTAPTVQLQATPVEAVVVTPPPAMFTELQPDVVSLEHPEELEPALDVSPTPEASSTPEPTPPEPTELSPDLRTWSSFDGRFSVRAELKSITGRMVKLRREDGTDIEVSFEKLSDEDNQYLRDRKSGNRLHR